MELAKQYVNKLIGDDSDNELTAQISRQAANVESSDSSFIGGPATSASLNPLI